MGGSLFLFSSPVRSEVAGVFVRAAGGGAPGSCASGAVKLSPAFAFGFFFFLVLREAEAGGVEERPREAEAEAEAIFCLALFPEGAGFLVFFVLGGMLGRSVLGEGALIRSREIFYLIFWPNTNTLDTYAQWLVLSLV